jgi:RsiW-degrading membrane proteinase PrsW (M82 family)
MMRKILPLAMALLLLSSAYAVPEYLEDFSSGNFSVSAVNCFKCEEDKITLLFADSPSEVTFMFQGHNPFDESMTLYFAVEQNGYWFPVEEIGPISPGDTGELSYSTEFVYVQLEVEEHEYAIIGISGDNTVGTSFSVEERWGTFETLLTNFLKGVGLPVAFLVILVVSMLVITVAAGAYAFSRKRKEYTLKTLLFPDINKISAGELLADFIMHPLFWLFELLLGSILVVLILIFTLDELGPEIGISVFIIGGVAAIAMPVVYLLAAFMIDLYDREPMRFSISMFLWGILAAFFSFSLNTFFGFFLLVFGFFGDFLSTVIFAPLIEEFGKGFGVAIITFNREVNNVMDGLIFGFAVGIGFAVVENWLYFASNANPIALGGLSIWAMNIFYRSLFSALGHGFFTAATGAILAYVKIKTKSPAKTALAFIPALLVAAALHGAFNFLAVLDMLVEYMSGISALIIIPLLILLLALIYGAIVLGSLWRQRKKRRHA